MVQRVFILTEINKIYVKLPILEIFIAPKPPQEGYSWGSSVAMCCFQSEAEEIAMMTSPEPLMWTAE